MEKGTEPDRRNWRKQAVNPALVGVALLIPGPFFLLAGVGLGGLLTMVGIVAVVAGIIYHVNYTRKLDRLSEAGSQR